MRKFMSIAAAVMLVASLMTGCRDRNVSDREDGMITDPTVTTDGILTMPSTDTAPIVTTAPYTEPTTDTASDATGNPAESGAAGETMPEGKNRSKLPRPDRVN